MKTSKPQLRPKNAKPTAAKAINDSFLVDQNTTLLAFLLTSLSQRSRNRIKAVLRDRQVSVDGKPATRFDHPLREGQRVEVCWERQTPQRRPLGLALVFEDDDLLVVNKPPGLLTIATDKEKRRTAYAILSDYVKAQNPDNKIFVIHRLDRETSGLLMFAKNETIKRQIQENWLDTIIQRTYVAVVEGQVEPSEGTITSWLAESSALKVYSSQNPQHGQKAVTHYRRLQTNGHFSLLQINLETGRKHQIRVHLQDIKHPVIGDSKYGSGQSPLRRLGLHAQVLAFTHPKTGEICRFETTIPEKFLKMFPRRSPSAAKARGDAD